MRILVIGGTRFVGRAIVRALAARGHELTVAHRGTTPVPVDGAREMLLDRDGDLAPLAEGEWDATVDVIAYRPGQVERLGEALDGRGGHHLLISTISVYDGDALAGAAGEDAPLLAPIREPDPDLPGAASYGALKVACEQAAAAMHGDALTIVRPGIVAGAHDPTGRFSSYVEAAARGDDPLLAPGAPSRPMQVIDARDLGDFVATLLGRDDRGRGTFDATGAGACATIGDVVTAARAAAGHDGAVEWVADEELAAGRVELPLWCPADEPGVQALFSIDPARARAAGLSARPLLQTAREVLEERGEAEAADGRAGSS